MNKQEISHCSKILDEALLQAREIERLTLTYKDLSLQDAYLIQDEGIHLRLSRGEKIVGYKMGLTSKAKMEQMGLHEPIYGVLTDRMRVGGGKFNLKQSIHPKIEPEIAFLVGREIRGKVSVEDALAACSGVCAAMEILDSRFLNFKYFSLPDVVADNCSSAYFVLSGQIRSPKEVDVGNLEMKMSVNGHLAQSARSSAILGHPVHSLVQLCDMLAARGLSLPVGSIVLAGAATQAVQLEAGSRVELDVAGLGHVAVSIDAA